MPCSTCSQCFFCDPECQEEAVLSLNHSKWLCFMLMKLSTIQEMDLDSKTTLRWFLQLLNTSKLVKEGTELLQQVLGLDRGTRPYSSDIIQSAAGFLSFLATAESTLPVGERLTTELDLGTVEDILQVDKRNSFGLMAPNRLNGERRLRATATYMTPSFINHCCYPNVARFV